MRIKILAAGAAVLMGYGCSSDPAANMAFDDVEYVTSFPEVIELGRGRDIEIEKPGILDICLYDTLMFVSAPDPEGLVSVYSMPEIKEKGKLFHKGNGPGELLSQPFFGSMDIIGDGPDAKALISDGKGHLLGWNILESAGDPEICVVKDDIPMGTFYSRYVNDSTFLCRIVNPGRDGQIRYLDVNGCKVVTPSMERLNKSVIPVKGDGYLFNILSSFAGYDPAHGMVVEASLMLNTINMYTLDGKFEKTICIGKRLDDVEEIFNAGFRELTTTFTRLNLYPDFFAVMYSGIKENSPAGALLRPLPKIYIFDWTGSPVAEIRIPEAAQTFELDLENGRMYTLDSESEKIRVYDLDTKQLFSRQAQC